MSKIIVKGGWFFQRVYLPMLFILIAILTIFDPRTGMEIMEVWANNDKDKKPS